MKQRAPHSRPLIAATLPDHRLTFESNEPAGRKPAYFANVRRAKGSSVPGALYQVDEADLGLLDDYEEIRLGVYIREELVVHQADGKRTRTIVYRMPVEHRPMHHGRPSLSQLTQIRLGYADWNLDHRALERALHHR